MIFSDNFSLKDRSITPNKFSKSVVGERCQEEPNMKGVEQALMNYTLAVEVNVGERCQVLV